MAFLKNSNTFSVFNVLSPIDGMPDFSSIRRNAFRPLEDDSDIEVSAGWVNIANSSDFSFFSTNNVLSGEDYVFLSLRVDKKKVPAQALNDHYREALKRLRDSAGTSEEATVLSTQQKKDLKESVRQNLLRRTLPTSKSYDVVWCVKENKVFFSATSEKVICMFLDLFNSTFGIVLEQEFYYNLAEKNISLEKTSVLRDCFITDFVSRSLVPAPSSDSENKADQVVSKKFLGQEFLIWLWHFSDTLGNVYEINGINKDKIDDVYVSVDDKIVLEVNNEDDDNEKVICHGKTSEMQEAAKALVQGKRVTFLKLTMTNPDSEDFSVSLEDKWFSFRCKTPKVSMDKDDIEGVLLEKIYLTNKLINYIEQLFISFLDTRLSSEWLETVKEISDWARDKALIDRND